MELWLVSLACKTSMYQGTALGSNNGPDMPREQTIGIGLFYVMTSGDGSERTMKVGEKCGGDAKLKQEKREQKKKKKAPFRT